MNPGASYLDALAVLRKVGANPQVKVVEIGDRRRLATIGAAVDLYRDALLAETPQVNAELAGLMKVWLLGRRGAFRSPMPSAPAAIIHWRPAQLG